MGFGRGGRVGRSERTDNVIILTAGLSGSSLLAGLLRELGYWAGDDTFKKPDYDTAENAELISLNERLLHEAGCGERFDRVCRPEQATEVELRLDSIATEPYRQFIEECSRHAPWVWKDPRLRLTLPFWLRLIDKDRLRCLFIGRRPSQAWVSHMLRGQVVTPRDCRAYMDGVRAASLDLACAHRLPLFEIVFEDLLAAPERVLTELGAFLGRDVLPSHVDRVYRGDTRPRLHGPLDYARAALLYCADRAMRWGRHEKARR